MNAPLLAAFLFVWIMGVIVGHFIGWQRGHSRGRIEATREHSRVIGQKALEMQEWVDRARARAERL
jgi:hypothetical protein